MFSVSKGKNKREFKNIYVLYVFFRTILYLGLLCRMCGIRLKKKKNKKKMGKNTERTTNQMLLAMTALHGITIDLSLMSKIEVFFSNFFFALNLFCCFYFRVLFLYKCSIDMMTRT